MFIELVNHIIAIITVVLQIRAHDNIIFVTHSAGYPTFTHFAGILFTIN